MSIYPPSVFQGRWLAIKLGLQDIQPPFISTEQQRERIRQAIIERDLADAIAIHNGPRGRLTYAQCYLELTGEQLAIDELSFGHQPDTAA